MSPAHQWIEIHPQAPAKPQEGEACNGCGVCCLAEPCPLGMLLSRKRHGACVAVYWDTSVGCYRCGALQSPAPLVRSALPALVQWMHRPLAWLLVRLAPRWISQGSGCDCSLHIEVGFRDNAPHD